MKTKLLIIIFCILISINLFAQGLDVKKQQLENLQSQLEKNEKGIEKTEKKKKSVEENVNKVRNKINESNKKIKQLDKSESKLKDKIKTTEKIIKSTDQKIANLEVLCNEQFQNLCYLEYKNNTSTNKFEKSALATIILEASETIDILSGKKKSYQLEKEKHNKNKISVQKKKKATKEKKNDYSSQVEDLNEEITMLEHEKQEFLEIKHKIEEEAELLSSLIEKLQSTDTDVEYSFKFSTPKLNWPVEGEIIKPYGENKNESYNVSLFNKGIDIQTNSGDEIKCIDNGVVAFAEWYNGAGKMIIIDHQNGFHSLYSHNSLLLVSKGDKVKQGQVIANSGNTGSVSESCLHFEIRKEGKPVNPMDFLVQN